jgi:hypothetical protein
MFEKKCLGAFASESEAWREAETVKADFPTPVLREVLERRRKLLGNSLLVHPARSMSIVVETWT